MRVAIIGGGLAGTACAYALKNAGIQAVIYESEDSLAKRASGNEVGLYNPRLTAERGVEQEFYAYGFFQAKKTFEELEKSNSGDNSINWRPCGALHLVTDVKKARRFPKTAINWGWSPDDMRMVSVQEASDIAGIEVNDEALYIAYSGTISPQNLCRAYAKGIEIHLNSHIKDLSDIKADAIILACGYGSIGFAQAKYLPLKGVRGQVTYIRETETSKNLRCALSYGGYIAPSAGGKHCLGSTFQPWLDHRKIIDEDDIDNIKKLSIAVPSLAANYEIVGHRADIRTKSRDHFPVIGSLEPVSSRDGAKNIPLYISAAHGSHGIISSMAGAKILAAIINGDKLPISQAAYQALSPQRFS